MAEITTRMKNRRHRLTQAQRLDLWQRWRKGQRITDIAVGLYLRPGSVHHEVSYRGGIAPAIARRNPHALSLAEREEISRELNAGRSLRSIADQLGRSPSTISREVRRNGGYVVYRAADADQRAEQQARRPKACKLRQNPALCRLVAAKLKLQWSPEQIAGWLKAQYANDTSMHVSHETIYRSLFIQARGVLKKQLRDELRTARRMRTPKKSKAHKRERHTISDIVRIADRPASVESRAIPGHWEGDLISGAHNSHIATLVERTTRFVMLVKVQGKDTATVVSALTKQVLKLPVELRKSLTWDRGTELAHHKAFTVATDVKVFFCDPQSPWQRGSNENTNGLLRQYFPDGTDLSKHSQSELDTVARRLNERPRKTLGFITPAAKFEQVLP